KEARIVGEIEEGPAVPDIASVFHGVAPELAGKAELGGGGGAAHLLYRPSHDCGIDDEGQKLLSELRPQASDFLVEGERTRLVEGFLLGFGIAHAPQFLAIAVDEFIFHDMGGL